jgi:hypothetical protein
MRSSAEVQAWLRRLEVENRRIGARNKYLAVALAAGAVLLAIVAAALYWAIVGPYAVLDEVSIQQHPASQGRLQISFRVLKPGKVCYRRISGGVTTDLVDYFEATGAGKVAKRSWSWPYTPGDDIEVAIWYRSGLLRRSRAESFPTVTYRRVDVVILMDTTESMEPWIDQLRKKCGQFSAQLKQQSLAHRFALVGFGDTAMLDREGKWCQLHPFTADVAQFQEKVGRVKRFEGGDLPESALDAVEEALKLPLDDGAVRRFYLVTDATFHKKTQAGHTAADVAKLLAEKRVLLYVFSRRQFEDDYAELLGDGGKFLDIRSFGKVLSEGKVLED